MNEKMDEIRMAAELLGIKSWLVRVLRERFLS
jgi:hypothetical protein